MDNKKLTTFLLIFVISILIILIAGFFVISKYYSNLVILDLISYTFSNLTMIILFFGMSVLILVAVFKSVSEHKIKIRESKFYENQIIEFSNSIDEDDFIKIYCDKFAALSDSKSVYYYNFNNDENKFNLISPEENNEFSINLSEEHINFLYEDKTNNVFSINDIPEYKILPDLNYILFTVKEKNNLTGIFIFSKPENVNNYKLISFVIAIINFSKFRFLDKLNVASNKRTSLKNFYDNNDILDILDREIQRADRFQNIISLVSSSIDPTLIDKYSLTNDSPVYDEIIKIISSTVRNFDYIFLSDERIFIFLPQTDTELAEEICTRINEETSKHNFFIPLINKKENLDIYWGITSYPEDTTLKDGLFENCELALKSAMDSEKSIVTYKSMY